MTGTQAEELLQALKRQPLMLSELHERARIAGSAWSEDQLKLFLNCVGGVTFDKASGCFQFAAANIEGDLQNAILEAVHSFGRPAPVGQVRKRLPGHFITTDEQVVAIAKRTNGLEVFGPNLIRTIA